jgi:cyanobactin maturation PatA/PatG family protease
MNAQVLGISMDSVEANAAFAEKYQFPYPLLSDIDGQVCRAYGVYTEDGEIRRNTFVIGPDGKIQHIFFDVKPEDHVEIVMDFLKAAEMKAMPPGNQTAQIRSRGNIDSPKKGGQTKMDDQKYVENDQNCQCHAGNIDQPGTEMEARLEAELERMVSPASVPSSEAGATAVRPSQAQAGKTNGNPQLVFALGTLGYDFGTEARRDSIAQHMATSENPIPNPHDPRQWLAYLEANPDQAAASTWIISLDATPIYAVLPHGPFAAPVYERLRQFLGEQLSEGVERVSIPGVIIGQVRLMSGQTVPVIWPELRCMYSWTTAALVEAIAGKPPNASGDAKKQDAYAERMTAISDFLERIYHALRNLGLTPQERAINYSATNAMTVAGIFEAALKAKMELDTIEVERSPICRPDSECWDVVLCFFDPENVLRSRKCYRFTVDVSDVCPVMVGKVRAWSIR